jgi:hypothetical protein
VVVADAQFIEDQLAGKQTVFPNWLKGQGPDADKDKLEFAKASAGNFFCTSNASKLRS